MSHNQPKHDQAVIRVDHGAVFVSLELSRSDWLVTSLSPDSEKMSRRKIQAGDGPGLLSLLRQLQSKAREQLGRPVRIITIQEAGLDGFWLHRLLEANGIESHVVDAASIAVSRRSRRAKTDRIDGEALLRTLLAWLRGEPRVCSMVVAPSPEEEARRRLGRERKTLIKERTRETNRIKGLLASQGVSHFSPLNSDARASLEKLTAGDGRALSRRLKDEIVRGLDRLKLLSAQIKTLEAERAELVTAAHSPKAAMLAELRGIGPEFASSLWLEAFWRSFQNRRQIAAYCGLAPTPWKSGSINQEQGISKAGNPRLRETMIELAWLWLRHQPRSALTMWFNARVGREKGRVRRIAIVALARKLLVALWRYVTDGVIPEGALLKSV
jgi:transposase